MRINSKFFTLTIVADLAAELMGLYRKLLFHVNGSYCAYHNLIMNL